MFEDILLLASTPLLALGIGFLTEAITEYFFGWIFKLPKVQKLEKIMIYIPLIPSLWLSIYYKVDLLSFAIYAINELTDVVIDVVPPSLVGFVVSGILIARFSSWLHDYVVNKIKILKGELNIVGMDIPFGRKPEA